MEFLKKNAGLFIAIVFAIIYILWQRRKIKDKAVLNENKDTGIVIKGKPEYIPDPVPRPLPPDWAGGVEEQDGHDDKPIETGRDTVLYPDPHPISHSKDEIRVEPKKESKIVPLAKFKSRYAVIN